MKKTNKAKVRAKRPGDAPVFNALVFGDPFTSNLLCKANARLQGDYGDKNDEPFLYTPIRPYFYLDPNNKKFGISVFSLFEEKLWMRKAVLRTLEIDCFVICFNVLQKSSLEDIVKLYKEEVDFYYDHVYKKKGGKLKRLPVMVVGLSKTSYKTVTKEMVLEVLQEVRPDRYYEATIQDLSTVQYVFLSVANLVFNKVKLFGKNQKKPFYNFKERFSKKYEKKKRSNSTKKNDDRTPSSLKNGSSGGGFMSALSEFSEEQQQISVSLFDKSRQIASKSVTKQGTKLMKKINKNSFFKIQFKKSLNVYFPKFLIKFFKILKFYQFQNADFEPITTEENQIFTAYFNQLENGQELFLNELSYKLLFEIIKRYFRQLPEPVILYKFYFEFTNIRFIKERKEKIDAMTTVFNKLPHNHRECLTIITLFFRQIAKNSKDNFDQAFHRIANWLTPLVLYTKPTSITSFEDERGIIEFLLEEGEYIILCGNKEEQIPKTDSSSSYPPTSPKTSQKELMKQFQELHLSLIGNRRALFNTMEKIEDGVVAKEKTGTQAILSFEKKIGQLEKSLLDVQKIIKDKKKLLKIKKENYDNLTFF